MDSDLRLALLTHPLFHHTLGNSVLPVQRLSSTPRSMEEPIRRALHVSHREALCEGRTWDVADAMAAILPLIRNVPDVASLAGQR